MMLVSLLIPGGKSGNFVVVATVTPSGSMMVVLIIVIVRAKTRIVAAIPISFVIRPGVHQQRFSLSDQELCLGGTVPHFHY